MSIPTTSKNKPLISVVIPTFNRASLISRAVNSVLEQTYKNFELIIIDDGSTDATNKIIKSYGDKLEYFHQSNKGVAAARNLGIKKATGKYICFLDSDDSWHKNKLETQVKLVTGKPTIQICYTDEIWIRRGVRVNQRKVHQKYSGWIYQYCLPLCIISPSSVMIHRGVFRKTGAFDESFVVCEDYDLWLRLSQLYPIEFIKTPLITKYGGHDDQLSRKFWGMDVYRVKAMEKMLRSKCLSEKNRKATVKMLHTKCDILINGYGKRSKIADAEHYQKIKEKYS